MNLSPRKTPENGKCGDWWDEAACKGMPIEFFYTDGGAVRRAKRFCRDNCSVREECLRDALSAERDGRVHGVRGGLCEGERRNLLRGRNAI
jgi:WhiB family redox-sensing transcriptional regulator